MAHSPASAERRAHLIREMARQSDRAQNHYYAASSVGSVNDNNAANDTLSQEVPAVRLDDEFQVNTSALRRAFPNFSQYGSSDEDSIEMGRGAKHSLRSTPSRNLPSENASENLSLDIGDGLKYRVVATPPMKPRNASKPTNEANKQKDRNPILKRTTSEKENEDPLKKATEYGSNASSRGSQPGRQTLAEIQPRVESDESMPLGETRASDLNARTKQSRFDTKTRRAQQDVQTSTNTADLRGTGQGPDPNGTNNSVFGPNSGTHQSFLLPDLPNIAELVSGVRQDGTPLFPRSAKSRSKFGTPGSLRRSQSGRHNHPVIEDVATPIDEKALYLSLQILQEKVANLEEEREQSDKKLEEYELEVLQLRSKLEEREFGNGIGDVQTKGKRSDKTKLERSMKNLQERLHRANQKASQSENMIKDLTKDRDAAHQQLATAYSNSEELKSESDAMRQELSSIKSKLAKLTKQHERQIEKLTLQESELRGKIERREKAVNEMGQLAKELWSTRCALASSDVPNTSSFEPSVAKQVQSSVQVDGDTNRLSRRTTSGDEQLRMRSRSKSTAKSQAHSRHASMPVIESTNDTIELPNGVGSATYIRTRPASLYAEEQLSKDPTFLSFMEGDEVEKLRRIVEEDRAKLKDSGYESHANHVESLAQHKAVNTAMPRKSSLKVPSQNRKQVQYQDDDNTGHFTFDNHSVQLKENGGVVRDDLPFTRDISQPMSYARQDTQQSVTSQQSTVRRRGANEGQTEMTSAFILPDITMNSTGLTYPGKPASEPEFAKQTRKIPRPTPVTDRAVYKNWGDVTRPSQSPGLALATVLKDLEDEVVHLRERLMKQEAFYHQQDPALNKQKRKTVFHNIQKLLKAIEIRSDQIYALYDVLEGQKAKGQTMDQSEVEVTLQNVGIDPSRLKDWQNEKQQMPGVGDIVDGGYEDADDKSESDGLGDDEELPWDGFEPTQTMDSLQVGRGLR